MSEKNESFEEWLHEQRPVDSQVWCASQTYNFSKAAWNHQQKKLDQAEARVKELEKSVRFQEKCLDSLDEQYKKQCSINIGLEKRNAELKIANSRLFSDNSVLTEEKDKALGDFKNFHKNICKSVGYYHDEEDWVRDLASLENFILGKINNS